MLITHLKIVKWYKKKNIFIIVKFIHLTLAILTKKMDPIHIYV